MTSAARAAVSGSLQRPPAIRELGYGFSAAFLSNFGQTFFISLFVVWIGGRYGVSEGNFGLVYSAATLLAAVLMPALGRWTDRRGPGVATSVSGAWLALALVVLAWGWTMWMLFAVLFLLRLFGQGAMSLLSVATMARCFRRRRGMALGVASLGHPLGEMLLPATVLALAAVAGHDGALLIFAAFVVAATVVLRFGFLARPLGQEEVVATGPGWEHPALSARPWRRDPLFWVIAFTSVIMPFGGTVLMLYLMPLAEVRQWPPDWVAAGFVLFGVVRAGSSLLAGWLVDRLGPARLYPWMLTSMTGALLCLLLAGSHWVGLGFFLFIGAGFGAGTVLSALLAELYGSANLAEIRATSGAVAVFGTAAAPALAGWALLRGWSFDGIFAGLLVLAVTSFVTALFVPAWTRRRRMTA